MSKSKGNTVNPFELFDKYGADAARWYLVTTSPPWRPTLFDEEGVQEVQRKFFGTLVNTYNFFALYANIDGFDFSGETVPYEERQEIDRWIISKLNALVADYQKHMDNFDVTRAAREVSAFTIDQLSNWYVRRCRRRFWKSEVNTNKMAAYQTLYDCLMTVAKLTAPFAPFIAEELFQNLNAATGKETCESVHLVNFPEIGYRDEALEEKMDIAQKVVYLTRSMRAKSNLKVRQPLAKIMIAIDKSKRKAAEEMKEVILDEVNIKELIVLDDDSSIVNKSAKANFKAIGPKYGKMVKPLSARIASFTKEEISKLEADGQIEIEVQDSKVTVTTSDVDIISTEIEGWVVETEEGVTVAIDSELTEDLIAEGLSRELVNRIQNMRKDAGLDVMDRINVTYSSDDKLSEYLKDFDEYIMSEVLADSLDSGESTDGFMQEWKVGDYNCKITIKKSDS